MEEQGRQVQPRSPPLSKSLLLPGQGPAAGQGAFCPSSARQRVNSSHPHPDAAPSAAAAAGSLALP